MVAPKELSRHRTPLRPRKWDSGETGLYERRWMEDTERGLDWRRTLLGLLVLTDCCWLLRRTEFEGVSGKDAEHGEAGFKL